MIKISQQRARAWRRHLGREHRVVFQQSRLSSRAARCDATLIELCEATPRGVSTTCDRRYACVRRQPARFGAEVDEPAALEEGRHRPIGEPATRVKVLVPQPRAAAHEHFAQSERRMTRCVERRERVEVAH